MDENPYRSPLTERTPTNFLRKILRVLARMLLVLLGVPFVFASLVLLFMSRSWDTVLVSVVFGLIALLLFRLSERISA